MSFVTDTTLDEIANATSTDETALPPGWRWSTVGELAVLVQYGSSAKASENPSGVPVLRMGNIVDGKLDLGELKYLPRDHKEFPDLLLKPGDLLFNRTNSAELVGKSAVYKGNPEPCSLASYLIRVRLGNQLSPNLLAYYLNSANGRAWARSVASQQVGQANVNGTKLRALPVPVPPLDEQRRIVAEIEKQFTRLDAGVASLKRVQAALKRYRASVLKAACEGGLVPTEAELARKEGRSYEHASERLGRILVERRKTWSGRSKYREPASPDTAALSSIPEGWTWATFDQISSIVTKGSSPNWQGFNYCSDGIVFVRSENVRWGNLDLSDVAHLPIAFNQKERKSILREGDILLNLVGASIGRAAIATRQVDGGNVNQAVAVIRLVAHQMINRFAVFWLVSSDAQKRIHAEKVDVARANFSLQDTRQLPIPLPPRAEQVRIVAEVDRRLSMIEVLEAVITANLKRAERLRQSIVHQAFTGEL